MSKKHKKFVIGFVFLFLGIAIVLSSMTGMTGFVISNDLSTPLNAILGLIPIVAGLIIIFSERHRDDNDDRKGYNEDRMRGTDSLRVHNDEAHYAMTQRYIREHGQKPSAQQLREYIRKYHETGELGTIIDEE